MNKGKRHPSVVQSYHLIKTQDMVQVLCGQWEAESFEQDRREQ